MSVNGLWESVIQGKCDEHLLKADVVELQPMQLASPASSARTHGTYSEEDYLTKDSHHRVTYSTATRLRVAAIAVSWASVVFALSTGIVAIVFSTLERSQSLFGYGLDAILDGISSMVVLWRFYGSDRSVYSAKRERIACIVISLLFLVAATCLVGKSANALAMEVKETGSDILYGLAICNALVSLALAITKVILGYKLESKALITDSVITFTGSAVSFGTLCSLLATEKSDDFWYLDPVVGMLCGAFLLAWGIKLLTEMVCCYRGAAVES
ncbi:transmembrane protein 163-like isoform X2 [Haliotis rufescens]|uniref:transmembrane protein 163-like isoform X2 n=1 Tax=Haliotis rufescens TaxID=6454 RepID=UPI00201F68C6|nr:transmembrane protein 163-like isoform X2 [Haliotis rufescens]